MEAWRDLVVFNAAGATALAIIVALAGLRIRRPALMHAFWLVVLLKLVSYPAAEVALVPRIAAPVMAARETTREARVPQQTASVAGSREADRAGIATERRAPIERHVPIGWVLLAVVAAGAGLVVAVATVRTLRMRRALRNAPEAPEPVQARVNAMARRFGITHPPRVRWVSMRISPALWSAPGGTEILFPSRLWARLSDGERDTLLAHELAHLHRGDPRIRLLELLIVALYWWHPVAWWARRNLRAAEELACDALVVEKLPDAARAYVEGLLKTVEFLAGGGTRVSEFATANDVAKRLKERMIMILTVKPTKPLPIGMRALVFVVVMATVLTSPAWIDPPTAAIDEPSGAEVSFAREELAIEKELHELETRRVQIQLRMEQVQVERRTEELRRELLALQTQDRQTDVELLRQEIARLEAETAAHREQMEREQRYQTGRSKLGFELRELTIQREELLARGDEGAANQLLGRIDALERQLRDLDLQVRRDELEHARRQLDKEAQELQRVQTQE